MFGIEASVIDVEVDIYDGSGRDFVTMGMPTPRGDRLRVRLDFEHPRRRHDGRLEPGLEPMSRPRAGFWAVNS